MKADMENFGKIFRLSKGIPFPIFLKFENTVIVGLLAIIHNHYHFGGKWCDF